VVQTLVAEDRPIPGVVNSPIAGHIWPRQTPALVERVEREEVR
jgi:hypothetical protein